MVKIFITHCYFDIYRLMKVSALQPVFASKQLVQDLIPKENKPSIVNRQCVVYHFSCDLCDAD